MGRNEEKLLRRLTGDISREKEDRCPSLEDISALIDGSIEKDLMEGVQNHIASCDLCYETFITASELNKNSGKAVPGIFSPWSIAATIFIALISFAVFFKVNVSDKGKDKAVPKLIAAAPVIREHKVEMKSVKHEKSVSEKREAKITKPGKVLSRKKELSEEETDENLSTFADPEERSMEPAGRSIGGKKSIANVQGVGKLGSEPQPQSLSVSEREEKKDIIAPSIKYKSLKTKRGKRGEKGLVERLSEDKENGVDDSTDCFRKSGFEYIRRDRFRTEVVMRDNLPGIVKVVQPDNFKAEDPAGEPVYIILEVIADKAGNVLKVCIASGTISNSKVVIDAVKKWKFSIPDNSLCRFRMVLGISGNRIIEILEKK